MAVGQPVGANTLARIYALGVVVGLGAYAYLAFADSGLEITHANFQETHLGVALTEPNNTPGKREVLRWGLLDKRPLLFAYLIAGGLAAYYALITQLFAGSTTAPRHHTLLQWRSRPARISGAAIIALLAYVWVGVPILQGITPPITSELARFHDIHHYVHLSTFEQIRSGGLPFVEAQTQYGAGNQMLMYLATGAVHLSAHGFEAASALIDVAGVVLFFVLLQQMLGFGWALACLAGWLLLPSPVDVMPLAPGWALITRWLGVPLLALVLAARL